MSSEAWQLQIRPGTVCTDVWARSPTSEGQRRPMFSSHQQMRNRENGQTRWGWRARRWCPNPLSPHLFAIEIVKTKQYERRGGRETERGGKFGRVVIRYYISDNLRVPSLTGADKCLHRQWWKNNTSVLHSDNALFWSSENVWRPSDNKRLIIRLQ